MTYQSTIYATRLVVRDATAYLGCVATVHASPFAGHPPRTVRIAQIETHRRPDGKERVTIWHEYRPEGWDVAIWGGPTHRVYADAAKRWWGRWHGRKKTRIYRTRER